MKNWIWIFLGVCLASPPAGEMVVIEFLRPATKEMPAIPEVFEAQRLNISSLGFFAKADAPGKCLVNNISKIGKQNVGIEGRELASYGSVWTTGIVEFLQNYERQDPTRPLVLIPVLEETELIEAASNVTMHCERTSIAAMLAILGAQNATVVPYLVVERDLKYEDFGGLRVLTKFTLGTSSSLRRRLADGDLTTKASIIIYTMAGLAGLFLVLSIVFLILWIRRRRGGKVEFQMPRGIGEAPPPQSVGGWTPPRPVQNVPAGNYPVGYGQLANPHNVTAMYGPPRTQTNVYRL